MNRRKGFSLVELLIVLAVMAALIATITPVALNAIKKAKATQVAQNLKTLSSSFENKLYVENSISGLTMSQLGRDIDGANYGLAYTESEGHYTAVVFTKKEADLDEIQKVVSEATTTNSLSSIGTAEFVSGGLESYSNAIAYYNFEFEVY